MPVRPRFDPKRDLTVARGFIYLGRPYAVGDQFPHPDDAAKISDRQRAAQYESRAVNFAPEAEPDPVQMKPAARNGSWDITAPWMDEPLTIRGKTNAEKALAELREEGAPLGWIEGGTEVEIDDLDGGWYEISAPWLEEPEKVQGREDAEKRQREIHDEGEPISHHGVTLDLAAGDNGYFDVQAAWLAEPEKVHGAEAATARAAELREEGPPEGWSPEQGLAASGDAGEDTGEQGGEAPADPDAAQTADNGSDGQPGDASGSDDQQANAVKSETDTADNAAQDGSDQADDQTDGAQADKPEQAESDAPADQAEAPAPDYSDAVTATYSGGGYYNVAAPWLAEPESIKGKDAANQRRTALLDAGPPEGWTPATD